MSETLKIIESKISSFPIGEGQRTRDLMSRLKDTLDDDERNTLLDEASKILSNCINPLDTVASTTGIAIGYVQSGKTMSFTTLTTLAIDNGFRIVIYFAGIKNNLLDQTTKRLMKDLLTQNENSRFFKVFPNPTIEQDIHRLIKNALNSKHKPAILITVLKHSKHIEDLTKIFKTPEVRNTLGNNGVLIIDDEADQASLNTYARKNSKAEDWEDDEFSSTYAHILNLKAAIQNHSYVQYTATPQGPLLINIMDLLSPKFHVVLTPGKSYTGGKTFFEDNRDLIITIPDKEVYHHKKNQLKECPQSLMDALQLFLIGVAVVVNIQEKEKFLSMMIHADSPTDASKQFYNWVKKIIDVWEDRLKLDNKDPSRVELIQEFKESYAEAVRRMRDFPSFDVIMEEVLEVIQDTKLELVIQGSREIDWSNASSHILVGADMLNRGYTVEGLTVSYMPRYSVGKSNADTIQQRCRFFGYKRNYLDSCRVFLPNDSILEYCDYIEHEEIMRTKLKETTLEEYEQLLILDSSMNPTRNSILSVDLVRHKLKGWRQMNALQHIEENFAFVTDYLSKQTFTNFTDYKTAARNHRYIKVDIEKAIEFLKDFKIANMPDSLRKSSTIQYMRYLADKKEIKHAYIFEMSYGVIGGRKRELLTPINGMKINNIFSGADPKSITVNPYPSDRGICFDDSICIQIHKIKLEHASMQWDKKMLYTLGLYYPETFAHSFIGITK